jgi:hypothetical protein
MAINDGEVGRAVRRDSPWWSDMAWVDRDRDLRAAQQSGLDYDPSSLKGIVPDGLGAGGEDAARFAEFGDEFGRVLGLAAVVGVNLD